MFLLLVIVCLFIIGLHFCFGLMVMDCVFVLRLLFRYLYISINIVNKLYGQFIEGILFIIFLGFLEMRNGRLEIYINILKYNRK